MNNSEVCDTGTTHVSCNGCESNYDHPLVCFKIDEKTKTVVCPYCGKKFVLQEQA